MRALLAAVALLALGCDDKVVLAPTDIGFVTDTTTGPSDDGPRFPPDMSALPVIEYIDCDMGPQPFLRIDGGFCIFCYAPNRPCCATAPKCSGDTTCNDAGPLNWCQ